MTPASAMFVGTVVHNRLRPRAHRLRYSAYWVLLDLDEIDEVAAGVWLFSRNRFNLFSFYDRDHGDGSERPLREQVAARLGEAGVDPDVGRIRLLAMPRVLGYVFNPLSVYFCYGRSGQLAAILYEVHNTFGERHTYTMSVDPAADDRLTQRCAKRFYVSPFIGMNIGYRFRVKPPEEDVTVGIAALDESGPLMSAVLVGKRRPLSDAGLSRAFLSIPLLTVKVIAAIHWEAFRLWLKGVPIHPRNRRDSEPAASWPPSVERQWRPHGRNSD